MKQLDLLSHVKVKYLAYRAFVAAYKATIKEFFLFYSYTVELSVASNYIIVI